MKNCKVEFSTDWHYWGIGVAVFLGNKVRSIDFHIGPLLFEIEFFKPERWNLNAENSGMWLSWGGEE